MVRRFGLLLYVAERFETYGERLGADPVLACKVAEKIVVEEIDEFLARQIPFNELARHQQ